MTYTKKGRHFQGAFFIVSNVRRYHTFQVQDLLVMDHKKNAG